MSTILMLLVFIVLAVVTLIPFYSIFLASLRPGSEIMLPLYQLTIKLKLMDSMWGIILPAVAYDRSAFQRKAHPSHRPELPDYTLRQ